LIEISSPLKHGLGSCDAGILHELDKAWANILETLDCDATVACAKLRVETDFGVDATKQGQGQGQTNCVAGEDKAATWKSKTQKQQSVTSHK